MDSGGWRLLRPGVERKPLAANPGLGIQADLIRIRPNLTDLPHTHDGFEWVWVLEGGFKDQKGEHKAGDFVVNTTEGVHQLTTGQEGCLLYIVWTGSVTPAK